MGLLKLLLVTLACVATASSQLQPTISDISRDQLQDIGSTAHLHCSVKHGGEYAVLWSKVDHNTLGNTLIISSANLLLINDERFSLRIDRANSTYYLQINDIQDKDEGHYQCQVIISPNERVTADVKLQLRRPPVILGNSTRTLVVREGQSVRLECYANGYPPPEIFWRRENNIIFPSGVSIYRGNLLEILNISKEAHGTYFCVADNGVGKKVKHSVELNVEFPPMVSVPRPRVGQALQYDTDIDCNVESYPPAGIYWLRNDTAIQNSGKYSMAHFSTAEPFASSVLRIMKLQPDDYGTYACKAVNKLGTSQATVDVFATQDPVCPPACNVRPITDVLGATNSTTLKK